MSDYWIKKVRKDTDNNDVIEKVQYSHSLEYNPSSSKTKAQVIKDISEKDELIKTATKSNGDWKEGEEVHVYDDEWIRTDKDETKKDNLGELPTF